MKRLIIAFGLILMLINSCSLDLPKDPKAPKWDVEIEKIPLLNADTLRVGDQLTADNFKRIGTDSILSISVGSTTYFDLKDELSLPAQDASFSDQLGNFEVSVNQVVSTEIQFTRLFPDLAPYMGNDVVVPPTTISPTESSVDLKDFEYISVASGGIEVVVENKLGFVLDGDLKLDLIDVGFGNSLIETIPLTKIEYGESATYDIDLAGKKISANLKVIIYGNLVGSNGQMVTIPLDSGIDIAVTPKKIIVDEAKAKIPAQTFELSGSVDINTDSLKIRQAKIESGFIDITLNNQFQFDVHLEMTLPDVTDENGVVKKVSLAIEKVSTKVIHISLDRTTISLNSGDLRFDLKMSISPDPDKYFTLRSTDSITAQVAVSEINIESITGDFDLNTKFPEINEKVFDDLPAELNELSFRDVVLTISFLNSPFDLGLNVNIIARRDNVTKQLIINQTVTTNSSLVLNRDGVNNDHSTPTIVDIINMMPEQLIINGDVRVMGQNVTVNKNDEIGIKYDMSFPLIFSTSGASYEEQDSLTMENDMRDFLKENCLTAGISLTVENGLPLSGKLSLLVGVDSTDISTEILSLGLPRPTLVNGVVSQAGSETYDIKMDESTFIAIANAYFYKFIVSIDDVSEATLTANDYIIVKDVYISGKFLIDPEGMSEEDNNGNN